TGPATVAKWKAAVVQPFVCANCTGSSSCGRIVPTEGAEYARTTPTPASSANVHATGTPGDVVHRNASATSANKPCASIATSRHGDRARSRAGRYRGDRRRPRPALLPQPVLERLLELLDLRRDDEPAVAVAGVLRQVVLVIILGFPERLERDDLRDDRSGERA